MPRHKVDFAVVGEIALALPDVEDGSMHGAPAWKVRGRLLTCQAINKSAEPNSLAVRVSFDERARLLAAEPGTYYLTDHYLNYPVVLVRLSQIDRESLRNLLGAAWLFVSEKARKGGRKKRTSTAGKSPALPRRVKR
jgi:hypothetical protein